MSHEPGSARTVSRPTPVTTQLIDKEKKFEKTAASTPRSKIETCLATDRNMASRQSAKTTFEADQVIRPIHTGGSVALDNGAGILATTLGEDVILTNPANGRHLARIEGVCLHRASQPVAVLTPDSRMENRYRHWR